MHEYEKRKDELPKEQDTYKDMRLVQEMYARGFEFLPLDIYKSEPHHFQIVDGKLLPALNTIDGLGDNAAVAIAEAAKDGIFLSKDDFRERTKVSKTTIELMSDLGLFGDMPESISFPCLILARNVMEVLKNKRGGTAFWVPPLYSLIHLFFDNAGMESGECSRMIGRCTEHFFCLKIGKIDVTGSDVDIGVIALCQFLISTAVIFDHTVAGLSSE